MISAPTLPRTGRFGDDIERVVARTSTVWEELRDSRVFVTGGTGFFGKWLVESFAYANAALELDAQLFVLSRNPRRFLNAMQHLARCECIRFHEGDVRTFRFPRGQFSHVIHAATDASAALNQNSPDTMYDVIVAGTERVLDFCQSCEAQKLLFVSSGAVYGNQPAGMTHVPEDFVAPPNATARLSAYAEGKRVAEKLCMESHVLTGISVAIARCFCFVGPHLPLDRHFAIGNFLRDALAGRPIAVRDGRPFRSYMYAADLATWLWTILARGKTCRPYNVGSDRAISIAELADQVADLFQTSVDAQKVDANATPLQPYYVPDTRRARDELGLTIEIDLPDAIARTFAWYSQQHSMDGYKNASC